jgi:hypothetical protein
MNDETPAFDPPDPALRAGIEPHERVISDPGAPVIIGVSFVARSSPSSICWRWAG